MRIYGRVRGGFIGVRYRVKRVKTFSAISVGKCLILNAKL